MQAPVNVEWGLDALAWEISLSRRIPEFDELVLVDPVIPNPVPGIVAGYDTWVSPDSAILIRARLLGSLRSKRIACEGFEPPNLWLMGPAR